MTRSFVYQGLWVKLINDLFHRLRSPLPIGAMPRKDGAAREEKNEGQPNAYCFCSHAQGWELLWRARCTAASSSMLIQI